MDGPTDGPLKSLTLESEDSSHKIDGLEIKWLGDGLEEPENRVQFSED